MTGNATRALLAGGVLATPLFFVVAFTQAANRDGFVLGPHMISQLSLGDAGAIQVANFVVTGILFLLAAAGVRRTLPAGQNWLPRLIGAFGTGLVAAGVFVTDPANGYPPGVAGELAWHGIAHGMAAAVSGLALVAALLVQARRWFLDRQRGWAIAGVVTALVYVTLPATAPDRVGLTLAIASVIGWGWLSLISGRLLIHNTRPGRVLRRQPAHA
jgi:hypothetical protein